LLGHAARSRAVWQRTDVEFNSRASRPQISPLRRYALSSAQFCYLDAGPFAGQDGVSGAVLSCLRMLYGVTDDRGTTRWRPGPRESLPKSTHMLHFTSAFMIISRSQLTQISVPSNVHSRSGSRSSMPTLHVLSSKVSLFFLSQRQGFAPISLGIQGSPRRVRVLMVYRMEPER
jgi:hypothetical protein